MQLMSLIALLLVCSTNGNGIGPDVMEKIRDMFPYCRIGADQNGAGVYVAPRAAWKYKELAAHGTPVEKEAYDHFLEDMRRAFEADAGRNGTGVTLIADNAGLDVSDLLSPEAFQLSIKMYARSSEFAQVMNRLVIINSELPPELFATVWDPLLGDLKSRTEVYASNREEWLPQLHAKIPSNVLPQIYGGTNRMPKHCERVEMKRPFKPPSAETLHAAMSLIASKPV